MEHRSITYFCQDIPTFSENGYYYQIVKNRTLTKIPHSHDFFEIVFILRGSATQNIDNERKTITASQYTILSPHNVHFFERQSKNVELFSLSIQTHKFNDFLSLYETSCNYGEIYTVQNNYIKEELPLLPNLPFSKQKTVIYSIIGSFLSNISISAIETSSPIPPNIQIALEQIRSPENIVGGVEKLAQLSGYSKGHLERLFKTYFNKQPIQLIHDIRMELAAEYLKTTSLTVEQIAVSLGLSSLSQFHAKFKKYFNCTPHSFRKKSQATALIINNKN